jgi:hypothetical protein
MECAHLRGENERQAEIHAMNERDVQGELAQAREESEELRRKLDDLQLKVADAARAFEAMGSAERRLSEIAAAEPADEAA